MRNDNPVPNKNVSEILSMLTRQDIGPARAESIRAQAHAILLRQKRRRNFWKEELGHFYTSFLEPVLVSGLVVFYTLWAFGRAAQFLHL